MFLVSRSDFYSKYWNEEKNNKFDNSERIAT